MGTLATDPQRDGSSADRLLYLAVGTKNGPLVTPVLYGKGGDRYWFVTRRPTLKVRLLARHPETAWFIRKGDRLRA